MFIILSQSPTSSKTKLQAIRLLNRWLEPSTIYHPASFEIIGDDKDKDPYENSIVLNHIQSIIYDYSKETHSADDFELFVRGLIDEIERLYH